MKRPTSLGDSERFLLGCLGQKMLCYLGELQRSHCGSYDQGSNRLEALKERSARKGARSENFN